MNNPYLYINMSQKDQIHLVLFNKEKEKKECLKTGRNKMLLLVINTFLIQEGLDKNSIQGIVVVVGTGGFTSTRIATTVANGFSYAKHTAVVTTTLEEGYDEDRFINALDNVPKGQYVSATYSGEPNITTPKKNIC
jgi:tRNA A37 threonylcarbamoyladenosine modification protein TsaB